MRKLTATILVFVMASGMVSAFDMSKYNPKERPGLKSSTRQSVCLNGIWEFKPIIETNYYTCDEFPDPETSPKEGFTAKVIVPGLWKDRGTRTKGGGWSGCRLPDGSHLPVEWYSMSRAWYRRNLSVPKEWDDRSIILKFDGVAFYAKVFVNGKPLGEHLGPGTPFEFDISDVVKYGGDNELAVYVIDKRKGLSVPEGLSGYRSWDKQYWQMLPEQWEYRREEAGIWKDVFVETRNKTFVDDLFAMPSYRNMEIAGRVWVRNNGDEPRVYRLLLDILDTTGNVAHDVGYIDISVLPGETEVLKLSSPWKNPRLWDVDEPNLYYMRARLQDYSTDKTIVDEELARFGFREVWVEKEQIYLNGRIFHPLGDWDARMNLTNPMINQRYEAAVAKLKAMRAANMLAPRMTWITPWETFYNAADDVGFPIIATGYAGINIDPNSWDNLCREWREAIAMRRNHPSIILWSCENEGVSHSRATSLYMLQRRLDQILAEMDPTRPYYHDGHCRDVPEDPAAKYENGDLCGTAPISGGHYTSRTSPMSKWMHEFDIWRRKKPFVYGEAGTFDYRDILVFVDRFYGAETAGRGGYDDMGGTVTKMVVGSWRSYGVSAIMPLGVYQSYRGIFRGRGNAPTALEWNDFETPGAKPFTTQGALINPYEPGQGDSEVSRFGQIVADAFAPLLVTLQRDLRHNFYSRERVAKDIYVVNDTKTDQEVNLAWNLTSLDGKDVLADGKETVHVKQGKPSKITFDLRMPSVRDVGKFVLSASATAEGGKLAAEDSQEISVYPEDSMPRLSKQYVLYDAKGDLGSFLEKIGVKTVKLSKEALAGNEDHKVLIVAPYSVDKAFQEYYGAIDNFIQAGGVVLVLNQDCSLPSSASSNLHAWSLGHPVLKGLAESRAYFWDTEDNLLADCAITLALNGFYMQHMVEPSFGGKFKDPFLFEMTKGNGTLVGCNLLVTQGYDSEPEARLIFNNLLRYADGFQRSTRPVYFMGSEAAAVNLKKMGVPVIGLALSDGTDQTAKELKVLNVEVLEKGKADIASLGEGVLLVERAADLSDHADAVSAFLNKGGAVVVLLQKEAKQPLQIAGQSVSLREVGKPKRLLKKMHDPTTFGVASFEQCPNRMLLVQRPDGWESDYVKSLGGSTNVFGLVWKDIGKGRVVVDQIPYDLNAASSGTPDQGRDLLLGVLTRLGADIAQPNAEEYMSAFSKVKETFAEVREMTEQERKKFHFVNLKFHMNAAFGGEKYDMNILNAQYRKVPLGAWVFAGIPFYVVDADTDELLGGDPGAANSCIILKGGQMPALPSTADKIKIEGDKGVAIPRKAKRIHFLHSTSFGISTKDAVEDPNHVDVTYRVHYVDGTTADVEARNGIHIRDWWIKERNFKGLPGGELKESKLGWGERLLDMPYALGTMWVMSWDNPHPEKEIESLDIISADKSVPIIFAVTLEE